MIYIQARDVFVNPDGNQERSTWDTLKGWEKEEWEDMLKRNGWPHHIRNIYGREYRIIDTDKEVA